MKFNKIILLGFSIFFVAACERSDQAVVGMPNISIHCTHANCGPALTGRNTFIVVTKSGCGATANFEPIASGSNVVTCSGVGCVATVSSWSDVNNSEVTEIISGRHDICAYIDADGDTQQDAGEVEFVGSQSILDGSTITVDDWSLTP